VTRSGGEIEHVRIGPVRVRIRAVGDGEPLLMLMGIGGNLGMWEPLAAELTGRRLIMFDQPGTRGSSGPWLPATMAHNAWFASRVLRALDVPRADVLGYSWGGLVAQQLAFQHRSMVRRLVLACTTVGWGGRWPPAGVARRMLTPRRYYSREYFREVAPTIYGGEFRRNTALAVLGYAAQLCAAMTYSSLPALPLISAPTLVLAGDDDPVVPHFNYRLLARLLPNARLHVMSGAGHLLLLDRPSEAAALIEAFLSDAEGDGTTRG
jgi:poly(3-hydroxyoctanoate) depolymerase